LITAYVLGDNLLLKLFLRVYLALRGHLVLQAFLEEQVHLEKRYSFTFTSQTLFCF